MDFINRRRIINKIDELCKCTNYLDNLMNKLKSEGILNNYFIDRINEYDNKKKAFYYLICKRGPTAYESLIKFFRETENYKALKILTCPLSPSSIKQSVIRSDTDSKKIYKMGSRPRGYVLLVNIYSYQNNLKEERLGSDLDVKNLTTLWESLGFIIITKDNLQLGEFSQAIKAFSSMEEHANCDAAVVIAMSHGRVVDKGVELVCHDNQYISLYEDILPWFQNNVCEHLKNKPKLFFFQTCRGDTMDFTQMDSAKSREIKESSYSNSTKIEAPKYSIGYKDIIVAYSTQPGFVSPRDTISGAWFIQCLCSSFADLAHNTDLYTLLNETEERVRSFYCSLYGRQTCHWEAYGVNKLLFFNPGLYD